MSRPEASMRVLILGAGGYLGPHVVRELEGDHDLVVTDVFAVDTPHPSRIVDIADGDQVRAAAEGTDAIVNCAVQRTDRRVAFDVNVRGTWNALRAAADLGHERFVNTGPRFTIAGPAYLSWDFGLREEIPPHPGTGLYALSKSVGQEICRLYAEEHDLHLLTLLFSSFIDPAPSGAPPADMNPFAVTFADAARGVRRALEVDVAALPSRCELFFMTADLPQDQVRAGKAQRLLGWTPEASLKSWYRRPHR